MSKFYEVIRKLMQNGFKEEHLKAMLDSAIEIEKQLESITHGTI